TRGGGAEYGMPAWRLIEDAELQLVAVYGYDHWNRRVVTAVATTAEAGTWFHAFDGWRQVGQYGLHYASGYYAVPVKEFVWGSRLDELLSYRRRVVVSGTVSWETYYVLHGGQDTAAKLVSAAGVVVEQYEYDPYGRASVYVGASTTAAATSSVGLPFLWKAVRLDAETGLLYMRNRYYSTGLGRFLTRDPLGVWGSSLELGNECSYGGCGPLSWGDPLGLQAQPGPMKRFHPRSYAFDMSPSIEGRIESAIKVIESYLLRGAWGLCHYYVDLRVIWKYRWFRYNPGNPLPGGRGAENLPDETDGGVIGADGTRTRFDGRLNGIFIDPSIRLMDDYSLASLLVHEAVHLRQSIDGSELATYFAEVQAYAAQIAFLEMLLNKGGLGEAEEAVRRYLNGAVRSGYAAYTLAYIGTFCQIPGL
ncbi:MAG: hypothetical protein J0L64_28270, partial [Acidobacteria bacterium]|nr:hypothetical protein [Acidobacteriota bacterium]